MDIRGRSYDAVIVGAGPAGSVSAALLAARGWRVLLVEKSLWPRAKACGGCINAAGVRMLREAGLAAALEGAAPLGRMELRTSRTCAAFDLPAGAAIDRAAFDARLVECARDRGCHFEPETRAVMQDASANCLAIRLESSTGSAVVRARVILACDGLAGMRGGFLANQSWARVETAAECRIGFAATLAPLAIPDLAPGTLQMCVGSAGYVGLVRLADGRIHVGAALDPATCNAARGASAVIHTLLETVGLSSPALDAAGIIGTGPLTRWRNRVGRGGILAVGDACGYVEPFTGEGISWAIRGALAATELLPRDAADVADDIGERWQARFQAHIRPRQRWCWGLREIVGRPRLARWGVRAVGVLPRGAALLARRISV